MDPIGRPGQLICRSARPARGGKPRPYSETCGAIGDGRRPGLVRLERTGTAPAGKFLKSLTGQRQGTRLESEGLDRGPNLSTNASIQERFCTNCGQPLVDGSCPQCDSTEAPTVPTTRTASQAFAARASWLWVALATVLALATGSATVLWSEQERTRDQLRATNDEIADLRLQIRDLNEALSEAASTGSESQSRLGALERQLGESPDPQGAARTAERSVFAISSGQSSGSGFVVRSSGAGSYLVTNFHVIEEDYVNGQRDVTIYRQQASYPGRVVDASESNDLALINVSPRLPALPLRIDRPGVADPVMALGAPLGLGGTVTSGIVSAYRQLDGLTYMQFSAPISPGNSGGPVIDVEGRVVGITVLGSVAPGVEGLGFAIPVDRLCDSLDACR